MVDAYQTGQIIGSLTVSLVAFGLGAYVAYWVVKSLIGNKKKASRNKRKK